MVGTAPAGAADAPGAGLPFPVPVAVVPPVRPTELPAPPAWVLVGAADAAYTGETGFDTATGRTNAAGTAVRVRLDPALAFGACSAPTEPRPGAAPSRPAWSSGPASSAIPHSAAAPDVSRAAPDAAGASWRNA
jgi:hypothetical protein